MMQIDSLWMNLFFLAMVILGCVFRRCLLCAVILFLMLFHVDQEQSTGFWNIIAIATLITVDIRQKKHDSILVKYNPFCENNKVPNWLSLVICVLTMMVMLIHVMLLFCSKFCRGN
jgi:hypothetical protein